MFSYCLCTTTNTYMGDRSPWFTWCLTEKKCAPFSQLALELFSNFIWQSPFSARNKKNTKKRIKDIHSNFFSGQTLVLLVMEKLIRSELVTIFVHYLQKEKPKQSWWVIVPKHFYLFHGAALNSKNCAIYLKINQEFSKKVMHSATKC